jgi:hypothetical protein
MNERTGNNGDQPFLPVPHRSSPGAFRFERGELPSIAELRADAKERGFKQPRPKRNARQVRAALRKRILDLLKEEPLTADDVSLILCHDHSKISGTMGGMDAVGMIEKTGLRRSRGSQGRRSVVVYRVKR